MTFTSAAVINTSKHCSVELGHFRISIQLTFLEKWKYIHVIWGLVWDAGNYNFSTYYLEWKLNIFFYEYVWMMNSFVSISLNIIIKPVTSTSLIQDSTMPKPGTHQHFVCSESWVIGSACKLAVFYDWKWCETSICQAMAWPNTNKTYIQTYIVLFEGSVKCKWNLPWIALK